MKSHSFSVYEHLHKLYRVTSTPLIKVLKQTSRLVYVLPVWRLAIVHRRRCLAASWSGTSLLSWAPWRSCASTSFLASSRHGERRSLTDLIVRVLFRGSTKRWEIVLDICHRDWLFWRICVTPGNVINGLCMRQDFYCSIREIEKIFSFLDAF